MHKAPMFRDVQLLGLLVECVLERLGRRDLDRRASRDLDLLTRGRVSAHAGLSVDELHGAKAAERDLAFLLQALGDDLLDCLKHRPDLYLRNLRAFCDRLEKLSLRHFGNPPWACGKGRFPVKDSH
jgi:hypothetical protein